MGNLDIEDFFGSVRQQAVKQLLRHNGFGYQLAYIISKITTLDNSLPGGGDRALHAPARDVPVAEGERARRVGPEVQAPTDSTYV